MKNKTNILPSFFVIGTQKGATSWLYNCLKEHPDVCLPKKKREVDLLGGKKYKKKGWEWWKNRFENPTHKKVVIDVSVDYMYNFNSPRLIKEKINNPKFIVSLRNPIERAISSYFWNLRKNKIPYNNINKAFKNILDNLNEDHYIENNDKNITKIYNDIIKRGYYDEQLKRYLKYFSINKFLFIDFFEIKSNPEQVVKTLYSFLDIKSDFIPTKTFNYKPKKNSYSDILIKLERLTKNSKCFSTIIDKTHNLICQLNLQNDKPNLNKNIRNELNEIYYTHNLNLIDLIERYNKEISNDEFNFNVETIKNWK